MNERKAREKKTKNHNEDLRKALGSKTTSALDDLEVLYYNLLYISFKMIFKCNFQFDTDDRVFDVVDEDKYAEIVQQRRHGVDFVVDDGYLLVLNIA
jgi:hypothetical protein